MSLKLVTLHAVETAKTHSQVSSTLGIRLQDASYRFSLSCALSWLLRPWCGGDDHLLWSRPLAAALLRHATDREPRAELGSRLLGNGTW